MGFWTIDTPYARHYDRPLLGKVVLISKNELEALDQVFNYWVIRRCFYRVVHFLAANTNTSQFFQTVV
jgi:hypothetical protein